MLKKILLNWILRSLFRIFTITINTNPKTICSQINNTPANGCSQNCSTITNLFLSIQLNLAI